MDRLTEEDRGVFIVRTQGSAHIWDIGEHPRKGTVHVTVTRYSSRRNPFGVDALTGRPYTATVQTWPEVGSCFLNTINGGAGDIPWTRSSRIASIERLV